MVHEVSQNLEFAGVKSLAQGWVQLGKQPGLLVKRGRALRNHTSADFHVESKKMLLQVAVEILADLVDYGLADDDLVPLAQHGPAVALVCADAGIGVKQQ